MPTGYTANIIEGKITNFNQFAKTCVRAMGAANHMRDEPLNEPYRPDVVNNYYLEDIKEKEQEIENFKALSDNDILIEVTKKNKESIEYYTKALEEKIKIKIVLENILADAILFVPPTKDYENFKEFMIKQIKETLEWDCDIELYEENLHEENNELKEFDVIKYKQNRLKQLQNRLEHTKEKYEEETKRVNESNQWVQELYNVLDKQ